ncbi:hypothetical protein GE09DRAFT_637963 [Coniochaeta sp. 2T2.1]|nr:hypothetical protein GE09DRAFT_637963 [Coniochaeta sp. 2T2.1]
MSVNVPNAPAPAPRAMLPPPEERLYASFQDLHEDLKKWTLVQGYALSIDASSNRDATGMYRRYNMSCVKGGKTYKPTAQGKRRSYSKKTGCPMKIKCTKQDGWPWNGRWRVTVMCADHNHPPFDPDSPDDIPPAFRHVEGEGLRWLLIMHREAQLNLRQLTIGLRVTFGDKYKFIKKADVSNMLSKVKREEERELAKRPPGAPPLPPGTMTAFMAALLNPVPDPYANGVRYDLVSETWPNVPGYQSAASIQQQQQQHNNNNNNNNNSTTTTTTTTTTSPATLPPASATPTIPSPHHRSPTTTAPLRGPTRPATTPRNRRQVPLPPLEHAAARVSGRRPRRGGDAQVVQPCVGGRERRAGGVRA